MALFAAQKFPVVYIFDQTEAMTLSTKVAVLNNGYLSNLTHLSAFTTIRQIGCSWICWRLSDEFTNAT